MIDRCAKVIQRGLSLREQYVCAIVLAAGQSSIREHMQNCTARRPFELLVGENSSASEKVPVEHEPFHAPSKIRSSIGSDAPWRCRSVPSVELSRRVRRVRLPCWRASRDLRRGRTPVERKNRRISASRARSAGGRLAEFARRDPEPVQHVSLSTESEAVTSRVTYLCQGPVKQRMAVGRERSSTRTRTRRGGVRERGVLVYRRGSKHFSVASTRGRLGRDPGDVLHGARGQPHALQRRTETAAELALRRRKVSSGDSIMTRLESDALCAEIRLSMRSLRDSLVAKAKSGIVSSPSSIRLLVPIQDFQQQPLLARRLESWERERLVSLGVSR